jgi:peptidoglycan/LPS O-acetylase OafA/YrhL
MCFGHYPSRKCFSRGNEIWEEYSYLGGMDAIALGCLTALAMTRVQMPQTLLRFVGGIGAALLILSLGLTRQTLARGLESVGLDMTVVAVATCMVVAAAAQTQWRSSMMLKPFIMLGRCSYEVYLTHMFVVFAAFRLFVAAGKTMGAVPAFFLAVILIAGLLGALVAKFYSEPANRWLRRRWGVGAAAAKAD